MRVYKDRKRAKACHCLVWYNSFSPFSSTIFEKTTTDLRKWFYTVHLLLNAVKGISTCYLKREIGVTYVGGKSRKENAKFDAVGNRLPPQNPKSKRGRGTSKTPVVGVTERGTNWVYAKVMLPDVEGKWLSGKQLYAILDPVCKEGTTVATDAFRRYGILDRKTENKFVHMKMNHSPGQFSAGNDVHPNNIEIFWSLVNRQYLGTHHPYNVKHMQGGRSVLQAREPEE
ncbi:hypothetical protein Holit_02162 [Hollandina sp. SP2]